MKMTCQLLSTTTTTIPQPCERHTALTSATPPDGSPSLSLRVGSCTARATDKRRLPRGSRSAPGSRRLSHIIQIAEFSLPCLGVYLWLRTQVTITPATFRLPHPRPSARLGSIPRLTAAAPTATDVPRVAKDVLPVGTGNLSAKARTQGSPRTGFKVEYLPHIVHAEVTQPASAPCQAATSPKAASTTAFSSAP